MEIISLITLFLITLTIVCGIAIIKWPNREKSFGIMFIVEPHSPDASRLAYLVVTDENGLNNLRAGDKVTMTVMIDDEL